LDGHEGATLAFELFILNPLEEFAVSVEGIDLLDHLIYEDSGEESQIH
jgi:hypothetical protein